MMVNVTRKLEGVSAAGAMAGKKPSSGDGDQGAGDPNAKSGGKGDGAAADKKGASPSEAKRELAGPDI